MSTDTKGELLTEFAASLAYGSRTDLNFKFLAKFSGEEVAQFFQELLWKLGYAADSGDYSPVDAFIDFPTSRLPDELDTVIELELM